MTDAPLSSNQNNDGWCDEHVATAGCPGCIEVEMRRLSADVRQLKEAIYWALGERDDFPSEPPPLAGKYRQAFWWRTELRRRSGLPVSGRPAVETAVAPIPPLPVPSGWQGKEPWFKVGDKVRHIYTTSGWPVATVTEITERGFKYAHARFSLNPYQWTEGGETYEPRGYKLAEDKTDSANSTKGD